MLQIADTFAFPGTAEEKARIEAIVPTKPVAAPVRPRKLLVVTLNIHDGKIGKGHGAIPYANYAIELAGRRSGAYQTFYCNDPAVFAPENLRQFDGICFNNSVGVLTDDAGLRQSLLDFVANGKGFAGIHAAAATFVQWPRYDQFPAFGEMLGGCENGGHPWKPEETITLKVEDRQSPINAAFTTADFPIQDEVFQFQAPYSRDRLRVLLSIDTTKTDMGSGRRFLPERLADKDFAISWIRQHGRGRVFYTSLGHNSHLFWNRPVVQHIFAGIQYALGDVQSDATPRAR